jgi:hypothetical protein
LNLSVAPAIQPPINKVIKVIGARNSWIADSLMEEKWIIAESKILEANRITIMDAIPVRMGLNESLFSIS